MNKKVLHSVIDHLTVSRDGDIAIEETGRHISYSDLKSYSDRIAHVLVNAGLKKGEVAGVYLESGIDYISSILGVNKAGGIFMPLEISYPVMRMQYLLEKVTPKIIIT